MRDEAPKPNTFTKPVVRDHSPYCEATGPIVQQGFVAARIRSIQESYGATPQGMSHSPMTPCPVPSWLQITEVPGPRKPSLVSGLPITRRPYANERKPSNTASNPTKNKLSPIEATVSRRTTDVAALNHVLDEVYENEATLFSPRAIPSSLARPFEHVVPRRQDKDHPYGIFDSVPNLRQRRSVADELGSLVSSASWTGHDAYNDAHQNQPYLNPSTPASFRETRTVSKSPYQSESSKVMAPPFENSNQDSNARGYTKDHRDASLYRLTCSEDGPNSGTEPTNPSLPAGTDIRVSETDHVDGRHKRPKRQYSITMESHAKNDAIQQPDLHLVSGEEIFASPTSSIHSSHVSSATSAQQSKRPASRSASWFAKLTGYRVFLVDKTPAGRSFSRCASEPNMNSRRDQQQYQNQRQRYLAIAEDKASVVGDCLVSDEQGPQSGKHKLRASNVECSPEVVQRPLQGKGASNLSVGMITSDEGPPVINAQRYEQILLSDLSAHRSDPPSAHYPPVSQQIHSSHHREGQSSIPSPALCQESTSARVAPTPNCVRDAFEGEVNIREANMRKLPQKQPPKTGSRFGSQRSTIVHGTGEQAKESPQSIHWRTLGTWRGARKVQVTVSSDETDSFVVEAKLLGGETKDNSDDRV